MTQLQEVQSVLDLALAALRQSFGENLHSCILYGSAVRGDLVPRVSDLNLLIVLLHSTPAAHKLIREIIRNCGDEIIEPFVLGLDGLDRCMRTFAIKFRSIKRNYKLLHGVDVLEQFNPDPQLLRFLCEQSQRRRGRAVMGDVSGLVKYRSRGEEP